MVPVPVVSVTVVVVVLESVTDVVVVVMVTVVVEMVVVTLVAVAVVIVYEVVDKLDVEEMVWDEVVVVLPQTKSKSAQQSPLLTHSASQLQLSPRP